MNKYAKAVFCLPFAATKYFFLQLTKGKRFQARLPAIMSPLTEITMEGKSELSIGKLLKMHNGAKLRVRNNGNLKIGNNFGMSNGCVVTAYENISIGDNVMLGPNVLIYDQDHDYSADGGIAAMKFKTSPIKIGNNVWIGANTLILRGTTIGDNCVIGGGTILKGTIPPNRLVIQKRNTEVKKIVDGSHQTTT